MNGVQYIAPDALSEESPTAASTTDETPTALVVYDECSWKTFSISGVDYADDIDNEEPFIDSGV
jgi:hypothetical protein